MGNDGFCSIHGMPAGQCFEMHHPELPVNVVGHAVIQDPRPMHKLKVPSIEERHLRLQKLHTEQGFCEMCDPANKKEEAL